MVERWISLSNHGYWHWGKMAGVFCAKIFRSFEYVINRMQRLNIHIAGYTYVLFEMFSLALQRG